MKCEESTNNLKQLFISNKWNWNENEM